MSQEITYIVERIMNSANGQMIPIVERIETLSVGVVGRLVEKYINDPDAYAQDIKEMLDTLALLVTEEMMPHEYLIEITNGMHTLMLKIDAVVVETQCAIHSAYNFNIGESV
jgi:hypothetical protein